MFRWIYGTTYQKLTTIKWNQVGSGASYNCNNNNNDK